MKKIARLVAKTAVLLFVYNLLQILFVSLATAFFVKIATNSGDIPENAMDFIHNAKYLQEHPAVQDCIVNARALGIFLSTVSMLLFLHFAGYYKLHRGLLHSVAPRPLLFSTLLVFSSMFALNIFVQWFPLEDNLSDVFSGLSNNVLGILGLAVLAPLLEEVLFRGAIQGIMMRVFGRPWPAIITAALIFGVIHWNPVQIVYATLFGIVLGWIYYRTGSLLSVIVGHVLNNTLAVLTTASTTVSANEEVVSDTSASVVGFLLFASLSVFLAMKLNRSLPPVEEVAEEND